MNFLIYLEYKLKINMNTIFKISVLGLSTLFFISCQKDQEELAQEPNFEALSMQTLENLSQIYPAEDIVLKVTKDNGVNSAIYELTGSTRETIELGQFASKVSEEDGVDCDSAISCGKAIKNCLDKGGKATISNAECRSYCVTCEEK